jgi:hypothetical protein
MEPVESKIELTYENLNDQGFMGALKGLVNHKFDAFTTTYKIKKILDKVNSESKKAGAEWEKKLASIEMVEVENNGRKDRQPKDMAAFERMQEEFVLTKCDVGNHYKIHFNEILGYKMSAADMLGLEPILTGYDVLEKGGDDGEAA